MKIQLINHGKKDIFKAASFKRKLSVIRVLFWIAIFGEVFSPINKKPAAEYRSRVNLHIKNANQKNSISPDSRILKERSGKAEKLLRYCTIRKHSPTGAV